MSAPGVKLQFVDHNRPAIARLRTDICGFLAYTERGPLDRAVKLTSWRQFQDAFGPPLEFAHGGQAVRLFFENGGVACYVMRVCDPDAARLATLDLAGVVTLRAAFSSIEEAGTDDTGPAAQAGATVSDSPGAWGNQLSISIRAGGMGVANSLVNQPADGASIRVDTIAGFHVHSWVRLIQDGDPRGTYGQIASIDTQLREITWTVPMNFLGLDYARTVRLESVEFSLVVSFGVQEIARHSDLSLDPGHPRFIDHTLGTESAVIAAKTETDPAPQLDQPENWPKTGAPRNLSGGANGLATVTRHDFLEALRVFEKIDEISVLAAPDLVLQATPPAPEIAPKLPDDLCHIPEALPVGVVNGIVRQAGDGVPVAGVRVSSADASTRAAITAADGTFTLTGLPLGQVTLHLDKLGYSALDVTVQTFAAALLQPQGFEITFQSLPPALIEDDVFEVQQAMISQGERGFYRVAVLDPPQSMLRVEDIQSWRSRFDSSYAALYWPWLTFVPPGQTLARNLPPSGAVTGLIARMDRTEGPQRAPANRPFHDVQALSNPVEDPTHDFLNQLGINVIRATPGRGIAPQGARTLSSDAQWRYLGVRRLMLMIAEAIEEGHQWAVFEPNNRILRDAIRHSLSAFLSALWSRGAFAGTSPEAAFAIKCDEENNPSEVIDAGQLVAQIAVAPVRPYEFIKLRLGRTDRMQVQIEK